MNKTRSFLRVTGATVFTLCLAIAALHAGAQDNKTLATNLKKHISTLASDAYMGRESGTKGESMASDYIISQFKAIGLEPYGGKGSYLQPFPFTAGISYGKNNSFKLNNVAMKIDSQYFPMAYSGNVSATGEIVYTGYGISADSIHFNDYSNLKDLKGKVFLMEAGNPDASNPHSKYAAFADYRTKIDTAIAKGAVAIIFINTDTAFDDPRPRDYSVKITASTIPVIFSKLKKDQLLKDKHMAAMSVELTRIERTGHNVIGRINNHMQFTVVIGAHYDHLGMGEDGSLYRGAPAVHNGADDNASGTAALIELARYLKDLSGKKPDQHYNYVFMAFSGEEKGLFGSASYVKNPVFPLDSINYMLNYDMIGRMKEDHQLAINGTGTSPEWAPLINSLHVDSIKPKLSESGIGPSDQTSFYLKDIPVLHFFTGTHSDYHKPSDDEDKINYPGEISVIHFTQQIIAAMNDKPKVPFTKTQDASKDDVPRFKVTLGIVPDYMYDGDGIRADGVTEGKPAAKAGLQAGDIIVELGEHKITDMMSYMKALAAFKKGDETTVKVKRGDKLVDSKVTF